MSLDELIEKDYLPPKVPFGFFSFKYRPTLERRLEGCDVLLVTATLTRSGDGMVALES